MVEKILYSNGRASAPQTDLSMNNKPNRPRYDLIERLREVRAQGDRSMAAMEEYDPDFSLKLSSCSDKLQAERLLDDWLSHRVGVLTHIRSELKRVWKEAQE